MNASIKTPFTEMSIEMGQEQAMDLIRRAVGYSMAPTEKQETTEPAVINNTALAAGTSEAEAAPKKKPVPESRDNVPVFMTIRQAAKTGIITEYTLRLMEKQGRLPGIRSGNRFLVNVPMLEQQLDRESAANAQAGTDLCSEVQV